MDLTLDDIQSDYNWAETFAFASKRENGHKDYSVNDILAIIAADNGCNDGLNWVGLFLMKDGKFLYVSAGCDYTGWDCQCGGNSSVFNSLAEAVNFGCIEDDRERLGLALISSE